MRKKRSTPRPHPGSTLADIGEIVDASRRAAARSVNAVMTATYWAVGRRIAQQEQRGGLRDPLSDDELVELAAELTARFGRGYSVRALRTMRVFFAAYANLRSGVRGLEAPVDLSNYFEELRRVATAFPLSWSHYVRLVRVADPNERAFYECEALQRGWTVRQLAEQIRSGLYRRTQPARDAAAIRRALRVVPVPPALPDEVLRDPRLRHFLDVPPAPGRAGTRGRGSPAREVFGAWLARAVATTHAREAGPSWPGAGSRRSRGVWLQ